MVGQRSVSDEVVRRQLTFKPGDLHKRTEIRKSQRNLYSLELFEFVNVEPRTDQVQQMSEIPTRVTVAEGQHQRMTFGTGYGTEEKARARVRWDHVNFLGNARHAGFEGKWSSLDRGVRLDYTEPYLIAQHFSLKFEGQAWQAAEPLYRLDSLGGRAILRRRINGETNLSVSPLQRPNSSSSTRFETPASAKLGGGNRGRNAADHVPPRRARWHRSDFLLQLLIASHRRLRSRNLTSATHPY